MDIFPSSGGTVGCVTTIDSGVGIAVRESCPSRGVKMNNETIRLTGTIKKISVYFQKLQ